MNIFVESIKAKNICNIGNQYIEFVFDSQLMVFVGPNGSGKSTIEEILCFCITGEPYKKVNIEALLNDKNKRGTLDTQCKIKKNDDTYIITRGFSKTKSHYSFNKNGVDLPLEGKAGFQRMIEDLIGLSKKEMRQLIFFSLDFYEPFMQLKTDAKRSFLREFFSLEKYDEMKSKLKEDMKDYNDSKSDIESKIVNVEEFIVESKDKLTELETTSNKRIEELTDSFTTVEKGIADLQKEEKDRKEEYDEYNKALEEQTEFSTKKNKLDMHFSKLEDIKKNIKQKNAILEELDDQIGELKKQLKGHKLETLDNKIARLQRTVDSLSDSITQDKIKLSALIANTEKVKKYIIENDDLILKIKNKEEEQTKLGQEKDILVKLEKGRDIFIKLEKERSDMESTTATYKKDIKTLNEQIAFFKTTEICPTCHSELSEKMRSANIEQFERAIEKTNLLLKMLTDNYEEKLDEIDDKKKFLKNRESELSAVRKMKEEVSTLKTKHENVVNQIKSLSEGFLHIKDMEDKTELLKNTIKTNEDELKDNKAKIEEYKSIQSNFKELARLEGSKKKYEEELKELKKSLESYNEKTMAKNLEEITEKLSSIKKEIEKYADSKDRYLEVLAQIKNHEININNSKNEIKNIKENVVKQKESITTLEGKLEKYNATKGELEKANEYYEIMSFILSDNGIKKYVIGKYAPILNSLFIKYAEILESPYLLRISNDGMDIQVFIAGEEKPYYRFSGGQRSCIDIIVLLSFIELARLKNGGIFNLMILDEVTAPLDVENTYKMFKLLKEEFSKLNIVLITHKNIEKEMQYVDKMVQVSTKEGFSHYKGL